MNLDQRNNSKLIWMIAAGLVIILSLIVAFIWFSTTNSETPSAQPPVTAVQPQAATPPPVAQPLDTATASAPITSSHQELINEKILKDDVPQNESLAKEEVARLEDIQKQLDEQAKTLNSQHNDADQLIKLKEEQIKLLEQQLSAQQNS